MAYKIQPLVESGYDFKAIYPEKQKSVRAATNLDFYLDGIVQFLQRTTNNFTIENSVAHDLDDAIFNIVQKYKAEYPEQGETPVPEPTPAPAEPTPTDDEEKELRREAIELLEMLGDAASDEEKEALELLKSIED
jgi:hypothetical protein